MNDLVKLLLIIVLCTGHVSGQENLEIAKLQPELQTGFANGGWKYDRYRELKSLDANKEIVVADLTGPGVIRHIHTTRHRPEELLTRGIVLEIWFDDAKEPAVSAPLGDFFGDGCNGKSMFFTSQLIECAPYSYNAYIPMPFKSRARVILRNDTGQDVWNYSYVEWESFAEWDEDLGYFHATYDQKNFQLTKDTKVTFFDYEGNGHLLGRQFSILTNEPLFKDFQYVMEGNNEVDIDGEERAIDYLGTEDSFTFSWGFEQAFAGLRAGMPFKKYTDSTHLNQLSIYRFHDYMPIRFNKSIKWSINWKHEQLFTARPEWTEAVNNGGCQVDYATVFYWYTNSPGGYKHKPLPPVEKRK